MIHEHSRMYKAAFSVLGMLMTAFILCAEKPVQQPGMSDNKMFSDDFEDAARSTKTWVIGGSLLWSDRIEGRNPVFGDGFTGRGLMLSRTETAGNVYYKRVFSADEIAVLKRSLVQVSLRMRVENISEKKTPWAGANVQCCFWTADVAKGSLEATIGNIRPGAFFPGGSFGWTNVSLIVAIPENTVAGVLNFGIEGTSGTVWYDDVKITVIQGEGTDDGWRPAPYQHGFGRLRGMMIFDPITEDDLRELGEEWNANLVRYNFGGWDTKYFKKGLESADFDAQFSAAIERTDRIAAWCRKYGMYMVLDMMGTSQQGLFKSGANQKRFIECWKTLVTRYRTNEVVLGYDLANEPHISEIAQRVSDDVIGWSDLAEKTSMEIRKIDPVKPIYIEGSSGGSPQGFLRLRPARVSNVIYSPHMYDPGHITHQGVLASTKAVGFEYPGRQGTAVYDKEYLERALKPATDFQKKWNVPMLMGEFSCVRWAPNGSAARYISDCIDIFEKYNWDWCFHSFREWQGWNPEYEADISVTNRAPYMTDRVKLLRSWFAKNKKPAWYTKAASVK
ncbi:MAG: cellulase family glycosylhydrolase [Spirochaetes bacterium]|nr:cellulase family glycosylhydrolase [Spirochaetota bacterium]